MVRWVRPAVDFDSPIAVHHCSSHFAGLTLWAYRFAPSKFSGTGIVIQKGAQPRASHSPTSSNDDLANEKRAAQAALEGGVFGSDQECARADGRRFSPVIGVRAPERSIWARL